MPTYKYTLKGSKQKQKENEKEELRNCTICFDNFEQDETIKILPCLHSFHANCVDTWLERRPICPVCKYDISTTEDNNVSIENPEE